MSNIGMLGQETKSERKHKQEKTHTHTKYDFNNKKKNYTLPPT